MKKTLAAIAAALLLAGGFAYSSHTDSVGKPSVQAKKEY